VAISSVSRAAIFLCAAFSPTLKKEAEFSTKRLVYLPVCTVPRTVICLFMGVGTLIVKVLCFMKYFRSSVLRIIPITFEIYLILQNLQMDAKAMSMMSQ